MTDYKGKKVAVLGMGIEGMSSARFFAAKGANVTIHDRKEELTQEEQEHVDALGVAVIHGEKYLDGLYSYDIIVRSPGVKCSTPELLAAEKHGAMITSQTKLFFELCPAKTIGITGTKGKGTTTTLIYEMLKAQGMDAHIAGNIGKPALDILPELTKDSWAVLEMSSFQLQDLDKSPHIAVMLMVTSEHLDYHKDVYEYVDAKRNIVRHQGVEDFAILNRDYPATHESDVYTNGKVYQVSRERESQGDGAYVKDKTVYIKRNGQALEIIKTEEILLPGAHNLENICAATMAAMLAGVTKTNAANVLRTFKGLEHRLELVGEINGVKYYDDSFSTTPETAIAAMEAFKQPEILILGGSSKNSDFTELGKMIRHAKNIKAIIGVGIEWDRIKASIGQPEQEMLYFEQPQDMVAIVTIASKIAVPGDVVLLSPACASFGMFKNYKDRGNQFKTHVRMLQN